VLRIYIVKYTSIIMNNICAKLAGPDMGPVTPTGRTASGTGAQG
jgi:hypothetical protein